METTSASAAASASQASKKETRQKSTSSAPAGPEQAEIKEYYKPLGNGILKLFEEAKHPKDAMYSIPEIRQVLSDYIKASDLADPKNQK
jgi:translation initiation factor 2D